MPKRKIVSTAIAIIFIILSLTGILMYLKPFTKPIVSLHTLSGILFIVLAGFHLMNNYRPLKNYLFSVRSQLKFSKVFLIYSILAAVISWSVFQGYGISNWIYNFGNEFRISQSEKTENKPNYDIINVQPFQEDTTIEVEIKKGPAFKYPLFVIWIEDLEGNYLQTLYVSNSIASSTFKYGSQMGDGTWKPDIVRRPEAVPYWAHKRGVQAADELYVPEKGNPDLDGVSGATPTNNFIVRSGINRLKLPYRILMEVNQSYDWNEYYTRERFPEDKIYTGPGQVGQPAIVYEAIIDPENLEFSHHFLKPIGHSHHSGATGELVTNLSEITTALQIIDRGIVSIKKVRNDSLA